MAEFDLATFMPEEPEERIGDGRWNANWRVIWYCYL